MAAVNEEHKEFILLRDIKNKMFILVLADGLKTKEGHEEIKKFRNEKEAIKGLIDYTVGKKKIAGMNPRLTLKDALKK